MDVRLYDDNMQTIYVSHKATAEKAMREVNNIMKTKIKGV